MSDMDCPYCGEGVEVCHDDGVGYSEDELHQQECPHCEKRFCFMTAISFHYEPRRADCLNDGGHTFSPTFTVPVEYSQMECASCGQRRNPTPTEMAAIAADRQGDTP